MTKQLYIVVTDSGDGSNSLRFSFDSELISEMEDRQDELDDMYQSGDGLQVWSLTVPSDATYDSLSISKWGILPNPFEQDGE